MHHCKRRSELILLLPPANEVCKGYVFTGVCLSTGGLCLGRGLCPGRVSVQGGSLSRGSLFGVSDQESLSRGSLSRGSLSRGVSVPGDLCPGVLFPGRPPLWLRADGTHPTGMHSCFCYLCGSHCSCTGHCSQYTVHTRYHWNTLKCTRWEVTLIKPYQVSCKKLLNNINYHLTFKNSYYQNYYGLKQVLPGLCSMRKSSHILCLLQCW